MTRATVRPLRLANADELHVTVVEERGRRRVTPLVEEERLRFDFTHFSPLTEEEIARIEQRVNESIRDNTAVATQIQSHEQAVADGATALFGEKYGDEVRVVSMGVQPGGTAGGNKQTYSMELCGGTHVSRTGDIGLMRITSE